MTPFCSGLPVDSIPTVEMSPETKAPLTAWMQSWLGMIDWLQMCTRPDLATIFSLLSTYMHCPSPGHIDAVKYKGRHIHSSMDLGLYFTRSPNSSLESYIHFPLSDSTPCHTTDTLGTLHSLCDANWGPQGASQPLPPILVQCPSMNPNQSAGIFSSWGVVPSFGKLTRRIILAAACVENN
jgi:hypothetical protein